MSLGKCFFPARAAPWILGGAYSHNPCEFLVVSQCLTTSCQRPRGNHLMGKYGPLLSSPFNSEPAASEARPGPGQWGDATGVVDSKIPNSLFKWLCPVFRSTRLSHKHLLKILHDSVWELTLLGKTPLPVTEQSAEAYHMSHTPVCQDPAAFGLRWLKEPGAASALRPVVTSNEFTLRALPRPALSTSVMVWAKSRGTTTEGQPNDKG